MHNWTGENFEPVPFPVTGGFLSTFLIAGAGGAVVAAMAHVPLRQAVVYACVAGALVATLLITAAISHHARRSSTQVHDDGVLKITRYPNGTELIETSPKFQKSFWSRRSN